MSSLLDNIREKLARNPALLFEKLAEENALSHAQVIECLPEAMWTKLAGTHFISVLKAIRDWGQLTTIVHTADIVMEFMGDFPDGKEGHGFYNLSGESERKGLHGHLRHAHCSAIYLIERPFMNVTTMSMNFVNQDGNFMFKIFLGRDEAGNLQKAQIERFHALAAQYAEGKP